MPSAHDDPFLPSIYQISNDRYAFPRHRPPAHAFSDDFEPIAKQPARGFLQHRYTSGINDALSGDLGQRVCAGVQAGKVDAAVWHAGEDLGAVVRFGIGREDGVAVRAARVRWVGTVERGGRPMRRAKDQRVAC